MRPNRISFVLAGAVLVFLHGCSEGEKPDAGSVAGPQTEAPTPPAAAPKRDSVARSSVEETAPEDPSTVVAVIGGEEVTLEVLDEFVKEQLFVQKTQNRKPAILHTVRADNLNELLSRMAVQQQADAAGLSLDAFILQQASLMPPVSEAAIQAFYEQSQAQLGETRDLELLRPAILAKLEQFRATEALRRSIANVEAQVLLDPPRTEVGTNGASQGPEGAPVTIVEFSDYDCPFCKRADAVVKQVLERFPDQVRVVHRHYPLPSHPDARGAAMAAYCADAQGRFWEYHDTLFANQGSLATDQLSVYANDVGLDMAAFDACLAHPDTLDQLEIDISEAMEVGVSATPVFFVNGILFKGVIPIERFERVIQAELADHESAESS